MRVVVLGASPKEERYSNRAVKMLLDAGHEVIPVHPAAASIHAIPCAATLGAVTPPVHTVTLYVGADRLPPLLDELLALKPERVIFNPGTESDAVMQRLRAAGIPVLSACTLVLLQTGQF